MSAFRVAELTETCPQARVLMQHAELLEDDHVAVSDAQSTIEAIVERIAKVQPGVTWDGKLRDMATNKVGLALYESLSRRWLQVVECVPISPVVQEV